MCNDWNRDSSFLGNSYKTFSVSVYKPDVLVKEHIASEASITVVCTFLDQNLIQIVLSKITFLHMCFKTISRQKFAFETINVYNQYKDTITKKTDTCILVAVAYSYTYIASYFLFIKKHILTLQDILFKNIWSFEYHCT